MKKLLLFIFIFGTVYSQVYVRTGAGKLKIDNATISNGTINVGGTSSSGIDSTTLFAQKLGGWAELQRTADTATGSFTFVNLGQLQFTMTAGGDV